MVIMTIELASHSLGEDVDCIGKDWVSDMCQWRTLILAKGRERMMARIEERVSKWREESIMRPRWGKRGVS